MTLGKGLQYASIAFIVCASRNIFLGTYLLLCFLVIFYRRGYAFCKYTRCSCLDHYCFLLSCLVYAHYTQE